MFKTIRSLIIGVVMLTSGMAYASHDIKMGGTVKNVDAKNNTFVITEDTSGKDITVKINPTTDFEAKANKNNFFTWDRDVQFDYLQAGDWVEVGVDKPNTPNIVAEEVKIYRK